MTDNSSSSVVEKENIMETTTEEAEAVPSATKLAGTKRSAAEGQGDEPLTAPGAAAASAAGEEKESPVCADAEETEEDPPPQQEREEAATTEDTNNNMLEKKTVEDDTKVSARSAEETPAEAPPAAVKDDNNDKKNQDASKEQEIDITRPVKRARSAYFIFTNERRAEVQKQHPGESVAVVARALGQIWGGLSDEEKLPYQQKAAAERERVAQQLEAWKAAGGVIGDPQGNASAKSPDPGTTTFPVARIRKICKLDPEVKNLSKEALLLVTKASELALERIGKESVKVATQQNRRKLLPDDVAMVCSTRREFLFLREDIADLHRQQLQETAATKAAKPAAAKKDDRASAVMKNSKPLTDYFQAAK